MPISVYGMADEAKRHVSEYSNPANFARIVISHVFALISAAVLEKTCAFFSVFSSKTIDITDSCSIIRHQADTYYLIFRKFHRNILRSKRTVRSVNWPCARFAFCFFVFSFGKGGGYNQAHLRVMGSSIVL